ncbi:baculoviral IAP repeat-containing 1-like [Pelobates cultripes]|uniref:Baculoviral IAP repeat-containing 1-like n=1 Tax=Pelobates cultripes TaxID=61616 RepID=A0AAD1SFE5_PELCU|nr:baculoviral IAP repeat-containing 1-like [Pelobates cultripes]
MENHRKFSPNCGFIQSVDSGNISIYEVRLQPSDDGLLDKDLMESEEKRLQSFTNWPVYSLIEPALLAQAGFFFIGRRDHVQCFSCSGCLGNWLETDDPWKEHAKWFPECVFLRNMKSEGEIRQYIQRYWGFAGFNGASFANILDTENMKDKLDILISGIDNFTHLTELVINYPKCPDIVEYIPDGFKRLERLKRLEIANLNVSKGSSRFAELFNHFVSLEVLHLQFKTYPDFKGIMTSVANCKNLKELHFPGSSFQDPDIAFLADTMKNFTSLKVLNLRNQIITAADVSENLAVALGSLVHLENLRLPKGEGMVNAAILFIQQLQNLHNLQFLSMTEILNDESIEHLGESARAGHLRRICHLMLEINDRITESGWMTFFQIADNMSQLSHLDISRVYNQQIKCHATTVTSFVRFVSRLPSLVKLSMLGWLLDEEDMKMFNAMKDNHPQSNSLYIHNKWILPFYPNIEEET